MDNGDIVKIVWADPKPDNTKVLSGLNAESFEIKMIMLASLSIKDILKCFERNKPRILVVRIADEGLKFPLKGVVNEVKLQYPSTAVGALCSNASFEVLRNNLDFRVPQGADAACLTMLFETLISMS